MTSVRSRTPVRSRLLVTWLIDHRSQLGLSLLLLLALAVRLGLVLALRTEHQRPLAYEHGAIAENLLAGRGFSITYLGQTGPTSQQAPLYPLLVTAAYACFGAGSQAAILAIQLLQCAAGTWLVYLVMLLAWRLVPAPRAVGWCAGWSAALYPPHVYMVTHVQVALWGALLLTGLLLMTLQRPAAEAWRVPLTAGVLAGLMLLVEPILVLAIPVAMVAYYLQQPTSDRPRDARRRRFCQALAIPAIAGIVIAPWIVRNYLVHGEPVFVKSTFGYAFWQGNNAQSWGTDKIPKPSAAAISQEHDGTLAGADRALWEARHETLYIDDVLLKPRGYAEFAGLSEPERSRVLQARAMEFIAREPARYLALCVNRLRYMLLFDETNPKASHVVYRVSSIVWLVLAFVGLLSSRAQWRTLWPTVAIFGLVMGFHTLTIASARFRIPLEPMTLVWTSLAVAPALARLFRRRAEAPTTILPMVVPGRDEAHPLRGPHQPARHGTAPHETARRRSA